MKKSNKKKKVSIKRIVKNIFKEIVSSITTLIDRFKSLPKHIRYITYVWSVVILLIIAIVIATSNNNKQLEKYYEFENRITEATKEYLKKNELYPVKDSRLKLDIDTLSDYASLATKDLKENNCKGFSVSYFNDEESEYVVKSLIKCDEYKSKEYNDYKE